MAAAVLKLEALAGNSKHVESHDGHESSLGVHGCIGESTLELLEEALDDSALGGADVKCQSPSFRLSDDAFDGASVEPKDHMSFANRLKVLDHRVRVLEVWDVAPDVIPMCREVS